MRVVFMGTPDFAVPALFALAAAGLDIACIYVRPDAVSGRGGALRSPAVKLAALELGLPVRQPGTLRDPVELDALSVLGPDLIIVAAYGQILPVEVLNLPRLGAVNIHGSLLPRWRGAAPVQRAILAGDAVVGVSIMRMEEGLDTGPYCSQVATAADSKNAVTLTAELASLGAEALLASLPAIADGTAQWQPQDPSSVTYAEKVTKSDVRISPALGADEAQRRVRASMPGSPSRISIAGRGLTLLDAAPSDVALAPGAISCTATGLALGVSGGAFEVTRVKPDGKSAMEASAWARGARDLCDSDWEPS